MDGQMYGDTDKWMGGWTKGRTDGRTNEIQRKKMEEGIGWKIQGTKFI